jgi:ABC-type protease/lipase transport system fused ATPase/permease subunit
MTLITGAAGTGKTTLSRLLVGVLPSRYGQVRLGDIEIARLPPEMRARLVGYLPQDPHVFPGTVRENIARMGGGNFDEVLAAARLAGIHEVITRLPHGYDTELGEDAVGLSGSERRRIELARAIYGRPRLLVLDEPTAFLDRAGRHALEAAVVDLKRTGTTIFVTTQSSQTTRWSRLADKTLTLGLGSFDLSDVAGMPAPAAPPADASRPRLRPVP